MKPFILEESGEWPKAKLYVAYSDVRFVNKGSFCRSMFADILTATGVCDVDGWSRVSLSTNANDGEVGSSYVLYDISFTSDDIHNIDKVLDEVDSIIKKLHKCL